jgi:hypothetical protein
MIHHVSIQCAMDDRKAVNETRMNFRQKIGKFQKKGSFSYKSPRNLISMLT